MDLQEKRRLFSSAVELVGLELKGKNNLYTSHGGHMFSFVGKDGVVGVRLSKPQREKYLNDNDAKQPVQYSTVMKEYVEIDDDMLRDTKALAGLLRAGLGYVGGLTPK